jgi:hypothetical protein
MDESHVPPEAINSCDSAASPSPSFPSQGSSHPHIAAASASTPALSSVSHLKSVWKHFPMLNRSAASVDSKWWKFPHIGSIMYAILRSLSKYVHVLNLIFKRRKHRNVELLMMLSINRPTTPVFMFYCLSIPLKISVHVLSKSNLEYGRKRICSVY